MLAAQFLEVAAGARNATALDDISRLTWRTHSEGHLIDAEAEAITEAIQARRTALSSQKAGTHQPQQKGVPEAPRASRRLSSRPREKMFGLGRPRAPVLCAEHHETASD